MSPRRSKVGLHPRWRSLSQLITTAQASPEGLRIDLGSGYSKPEGFIGLDNMVGARAQIPNEGNAPDILCDLNRDPFPFPDSSVREVRSSHFMEHSILDHVIDESHRVLVPGGIKHFAVPYANSAEGMYPGHTIFLTEKWFHENLNFQAKFEILEEQFMPSEDWNALPDAVREAWPFELARKHMFNACSQMTVVARVRK
jgi:SAM-dependent methyltransferase